MFCPKCGTQNPDGSRFCTACGFEISTVQANRAFPNEPKKVQLKCKACGGSLDIKDGQNVLMCPYCGSKELIVESDKVSVARIRSGTAKDLVFGVMDRVAESKRQQLEEQRRKEAQDREDAKKIVPVLIALSVAIIAFCFIMSECERKEKNQQLTEQTQTAAIIEVCPDTII